MSAMPTMDSQRVSESAKVVLVPEVKKALDELRAEFAEQIGALRAELTTLQAVVKGEVAPLVRRVTRDDAA